jgi:fucose permease
MSYSPVPVELRRARVAVSLYFMVMGMTAGVWLARIPAVKAQAHLSDGALGAALFAVPVGLMLGAAAAERLVDRTGSARVARISAIGLSVVIAAPGLARDLPELMAALLGVGAFSGTLDVAQNAQGVRVENAYRRPVMTSLHATFSLGAIAGSLVGGGFAWAGVDALTSLAFVGLACVVIVLAVGPFLLPGSRTAPADSPRPVISLPESEISDSEGSSTETEESRNRGHIRRVVVALGILGVCGMIGEGAAGDWSAVYLKDNLGTSAGFAALGFAAFSAMMTIGRMAGDRLVHRFGVVRVTRACGITATAGLAVALSTGSPYLTIAGLAVSGAGLSAVVPQVFAAGGRADPDRPGSGLAKVVGLGYAGQTAGPAVIGAVASHTGLRLALVIPVICAVWIAIGARAVRPEPSRHR